MSVWRWVSETSNVGAALAAKSPKSRLKPLPQTLRFPILQALKPATAATPAECRAARIA